MKRLVMMAGVPASGKTFIRKKHYQDYKVIDCDEYKIQLVKDGVRVDSQTLHNLSKELETATILHCFKNDESFLYDSTNSNDFYALRLIDYAKSLGYYVELCYVKVSLKTALARNRERDRYVPEQIIREKFEELIGTIDFVKTKVDKFVEYSND